LVIKKTVFGNNDKKCVGINCMNWKKNLLTLVLCVTALGFIVHYLDNTPIRNMTAQVNRLRWTYDDVDNLYSASVNLSRSSTGTFKIYAMRYTPTSVEQADRFAIMCGLGELTHEYDDIFVYSNGQSELWVYRHINKLAFDTTAETDYTVSDAARVFENNFLPINYEETVVETTENGTTVRFITRIDNVKNEAFANEVYFNNAGRFTGFVYYYVELDEIDALPVISQLEAFYGLPVDIPYDSVWITGSELVYRFYDSILQPSYKFTGEAIKYRLTGVTRGAGFEAYVNAVGY
jgi:hypothetical protein